MIIDIEKIIVKDRIRKDFGDIQELADDIQQNGLINPPVVNKEYELLAGERRLRACKSLGWKQIEVRMMDTRDAEHELNVEISENENRKAFSKSERVDYMRRLLRIEQAKAKERQNLGLKSDEGSRADETTAEQFGIGRDTLRKEISIVDHKDVLTPEDFADWDEGKLSTNKAYQAIKKALAEKEERIAELEADMDKPSVKDKFYENRIKNLGEKNESLKARVVELEQSEFDLKEKLEELESTQPEPETVEVEVFPDDYEELRQRANQAAKAKREADAFKADYHREQERHGETRRKILDLETQLKETQERLAVEQLHGDLLSGAVYFIAQCGSFIRDVAGYIWIADKLAEIPGQEREGYIKAVHAVYSWAWTLLQNIERDEEYGKPELLRISQQSNDE